LWRPALESAVGSFARRSALRKNRRLARAERNSFQIAPGFLSVAQRRLTLGVWIELAIDLLANPESETKRTALNENQRNPFPNTANCLRCSCRCKSVNRSQAFALKRLCRRR